MTTSVSRGDLLSRVQELERVRQHQDALRALIEFVSGSLSSTLHLRTTLASLCRAAPPLFGAARGAVWLPDRRARELVLEASSDPEPPAPARLPLASDAAIVAAFRSSRPDFRTIDDGRALVIPLRGRRRALGVVLLERLGPAPVPEPELLEAATELGRHLSGALENTLLIEDVLRSRRELENTFNSLADLVVVCDRDLRVTNFNKAFGERVPVPPGDAKAPRIVDLVGPQLASWLEALNAGANQEMQPSSCDIEDPALGGRFSVRATPLHGPDQRVLGLVLVLRDRTPEMQLEAERAALGERLAQAEKLAALGQFVAGIAHELNNPLQGVLGHLELLRATSEVPRAMQPELRVVRREAERAAKIVNNLLVFAGSRRGTHRRVSLNAIAARCAALGGRTARRHGIEIVRDFDRELPRVRGDATLLQQALLNVITNAEHAIVSSGAASGRIRIATRTEADGATAVIEIADSGSGIRAESLPRIFEPFFTTKEVGKGTGLGLAIVYGIVHDHGGEISARNGIDGGAVFRISLPADTMSRAHVRRE